LARRVPAVSLLFYVPLLDVDVEGQNHSRSTPTNKCSHFLITSFGHPLTLLLVIILVVTTMPAHRTFANPNDPIVQQSQNVPPTTSSLNLSTGFIPNTGVS
jgi:hypothetical protein